MLLGFDHALDGRHQVQEVAPKMDAGLSLPKSYAYRYPARCWVLRSSLMSWPGRNRAADPGTNAIAVKIGRYCAILSGESAECTTGSTPEREDLGAGQELSLILHTGECRTDASACGISLLQ